MAEHVLSRHICSCSTASGFKKDRAGICIHSQCQCKRTIKARRKNIWVRKANFILVATDHGYSFAPLLFRQKPRRRFFKWKQSRLFLFFNGNSTVHSCDGINQFYKPEYWQLIKQGERNWCKKNKWQQQTSDLFSVFDRIVYHLYRCTLHCVCTHAKFASFF